MDVGWVKSIPIRSYAVQSVHTRRETTPRHPGRVLVAPHAAVRAEHVASPTDLVQYIQDSVPALRK